MKEERKYIPESAPQKNPTVIVDYRQQGTQMKQSKFSHYCPYSPSKNKFGKSILDKLFS